jgi:hypothetical protein
MEWVDYVALVVSAIALILSFVSYRFERLSRARPVLVFSMTNQFEWTLSNVGEGPATHVLVGDGYPDGHFDVVRCYPIAAGGQLRLTWLRAGDTLAAVYSDALDRTFTTACANNRNVICRGDRYKGWPEPRHQWIESLFGEGRADISFTEKDLEGKSAIELDVMRNRIYARHGHVFKRRDLDAYFRRQTWYRPRADSAEPIERRLSAAERYVIHTIRLYQLRHGLRTRAPVAELLDPSFSLEPLDERTMLRGTPSEPQP